MNFHDKKTRTRRISAVSNINNVIVGNIKIPKYERINLTNNNYEL